MFNLQITNEIFTMIHNIKYQREREILNNQFKQILLDFRK